MFDLSPARNPETFLISQTTSAAPAALIYFTFLFAFYSIFSRFYFNAASHKNFADFHGHGRKSYGCKILKKPDSIFAHHFLFCYFLILIKIFIHFSKLERERDRKAICRNNRKTKNTCGTHNLFVGGTRGGVQRFLLTELYNKTKV